MKKISEVKYGRKCIGFSVRGDGGVDECVLSLHPASKEDPKRVDRYRPAASIVLKREQIIDLIVWLSDVLKVDLKVDYKKGEK